jgi:glycosyltransferase involved in cell wall biosynthesis
LFASISEGSALVTYEAKASGCLLLVSQASGAKCSHMFDGLVHEVGNVEQLTEHINLITEDVELYNKLLGNSISTIPELTWDKSAEKLLEIYKELIQ